MSYTARRPAVPLALALLTLLLAACKSSGGASHAPARAADAPLCCANGVDLTLTKNGFVDLFQRAIEQPRTSALLGAAWTGLVGNARAQGARITDAPAPPFPADPVAAFTALNDAFNRLVADHHGPLDVSSLNFAALDGMAKSLNDSHTQFLTPRLYTRSNQREAGNLGTTTGITLELVSDRPPLILEVDPGSAAADAGVQPGDTLLAIDGRAVQSFGVREASRALDGDDGARVALDLRPAGSARVQRKTVIRRTTRRDLVHSTELPGKVGYIRIREFPGSVPIFLQVEQALSDFRFDQTNGVIIDLRDDPGGAVDELARILGDVVSQSPLAYLVPRDGIPQPLIRSGPFKFDQRLVVLVDEGSASSSELFAAAVQEYKDGLIVGARTCGCLEAAEFFGLPPDRKSGLEIATARVLTAVQRRSVENAGIVPDAAVPADPHLLSVGRDAQLEAALVSLGVAPNVARTATVDRLLPQP
ncbi:MAG: S41 family peptidase [Dehalococcoidia bacterium]